MAGTYMKDYTNITGNTITKQSLAHKTRIYYLWYTVKNYWLSLLWYINKVLSYYLSALSSTIQVLYIYIYIYIYIYVYIYIYLRSSVPTNGITHKGARSSVCSVLKNCERFYGYHWLYIWTRFHHSKWHMTWEDYDFFYFIVYQVAFYGWGTRINVSQEWHHILRSHNHLQTYPQSSNDPDWDTEPSIPVTGRHISPGITLRIIQCGYTITVIFLQHIYIYLYMINTTLSCSWRPDLGCILWFQQ